MASATALTRARPAGIFTFHGCLRQRSRPFQGQQGQNQRRWVGQKYLQKLADAEKEWQIKADQIKAGKVKNFFDELDERGFIKDVVGSKPAVRELFRVKRIKAYAGVDATASSLHLGHLVAFMPLFWMYLHGYGALTLIGTSTAKIGDPTGRTESRPDLDSATLVQNMATIQLQLKTLWMSVERMGRRFGFTSEWAWERGIVNNNAWWNKLAMLDVLRRLGSSVRIGPMLGRDNVKTRLEDGSGMSLSEFIYPVMQGWDWWELYRQRGVQLQIGGSDQYGNILMGSECVKSCIKNETDPAKTLPSGKMNQLIGFTVPLLTDASGAKFGKSAGNAIWLDPFKTSPYDMYGYFMRRSDADVERLLKMLTFYPQEKIQEVMAEHGLDQRQRVAQRLLAKEVVGFVHGEAIAHKTEQEHKAIYSAKTAKVPDASLSVAQSPEQYQTPEGAQISPSNRPRVNMQLPWSLFDQSIARIMYACGLATSIADGDRSIKAGGVYLGGAPGALGLNYQTGMMPQQLQFAVIRAWDPATNKKFLIEQKLLLIRKGKHNIRCIEFIPDKDFANLGVTYPGQPHTGAFRRAVGKILEQREAAVAKQQQSPKGDQGNGWETE